MIPGPVHGRLSVALPADPGLRPGETVVVHVIKRLDAHGAQAGSPQKWAVAVHGRVFPAVTDVPLDAGAVLRARVSSFQGKIVLTLSSVLTEEPVDAAAAAARALGFAQGSDGEIVARALARTGLPVLPETIQRIRALLSRTGIDARQGARAAATLVDRGIDAAGPQARVLLPVLSFGQRGGEDPGRYRQRPLPQDAAGVKEWAGRLAAPRPADDRAAALQAYNHGRPGSQAWVVIPFVFSGGPPEAAPPVAGTLRILYDPYRSRPLALTVVTDGLSVHVPLAGAGKARVYANGRHRAAAARALDSLGSKIHNMGRELDDTVNEGDGFDGFSPEDGGAGLPSVDAVG